MLFWPLRVNFNLISEGNETKSEAQALRDVEIFKNC